MCVLLPRTLLRVEPKGPSGFEDRTTFMVVDRDSFAGDASLAKTKTGAKTATADIAVSAGEGGAAGQQPGEQHEPRAARSHQSIVPGTGDMPGTTSAFWPR